MNNRSKKYCVCFVLIVFALLSIFFTEIYGNEENEVEENQSILAIINDETITLDEFNNFWNAIPDQYKLQYSKEDLLNQLVIQALLVQKAAELDLGSNSEIAFQIKSTTEQILIQYLIEKEIVEKTVLSEDEIRSYYEEHKEDYWMDEEIHALNILTETEEEANDALNKLNEGIDFSTLAQDISTAASASKGGDIGFIKKGTFATEIEEEIFNLSPGEISNVISTEKGFHIFKIIDKKLARFIEFDEVKDTIEYRILPEKQQQVFDQYIKDIEDKATIKTYLDLINGINEE